MAQQHAEKRLRKQERDRRERLKRTLKGDRRNRRGRLRLRRRSAS